jgi:hypothetical protein
MRAGAQSIVLAFLALTACAGRETRPVERLDPNTAVHFTILAEPWVYAREAPMLAANARDYLNVGVVVANRAGARTYWLGVVAWSTIDRDPPAGAAVSMHTIRLQWPSAALELSAVTGGRHEVGLSRPVFIEPASEYLESWYPLSEDQLRTLSESAPESVALLDATGQPSVYDAWRVAGNAMAEFVEVTGL